MFMKLTLLNDNEVLVNMDNVTEIYDEGDSSAIYFNVLGGENTEQMRVAVKESIELIPKLLRVIE